MKKYFRLSVVLSLLLLPVLVFAHPGHGEHGGYTITHYFAEPEHIALLVLAIAAIVVFFVRRKRISRK